MNYKVHKSIWCKLGFHKFSSGSYKYCLRPGCHAVKVVATKETKTKDKSWPR